MATHASSKLNAPKKRITHRPHRLKTQLAEVEKGLCHLEFGAAVSPAVPRQRYREETKRKRK
jgi:hypothetical protein